MSLEDRSLTDLFADLVGDISRLIRQEVRLARAETAEAVSEAQTGAVAIVAGLLLAFSALLVLLQALIIALGNIMAPSLAAILVGVVVAIIAFVLIMQGKSKLKATNFLPDRTIDSLKSDKDMITEKVK